MSAARRTPNRRDLILAGAGLAAMFASPAHATAASEQFVRAIADNAFQLSTAGAEAEAFAALLARSADMPRVARVTLGRYGRTFSPDQRTRFEAALTLHLARVVRGALRNADPAGFRVLGSVDVRAGDALVATRLQRRGGEPMTMRWRVIDTPAGARLVDIEYAGVFLAMQQAQDFAAVLDRANGNPEVLIARLSSPTRA
ncbi:MAG: phospholipid-binding protein MlaC [Hyphomonadaceae bacterium]